MDQMIEFRSKIRSEDLTLAGVKLISAIRQIIQMRLNEIQDKKLMIETLQSYKLDLCSKGSACDISRNANSLLVRCEDLKSMQQRSSIISEGDMKITFIPANISDITDGRMRLIGSLKFAYEQGD